MEVLKREAHTAAGAIDGSVVSGAAVAGPWAASQLDILVGSERAGREAKAVDEYICGRHRARPVGEVCKVPGGTGA